jgi:hypothetical protein
VLVFFELAGRFVLGRRWSLSRLGGGCLRGRGRSLASGGSAFCVLAARRLRRSRGFLELFGRGLPREAHRCAAHEAAGSMIPGLRDAGDRAVSDRGGELLSAPGGLLGLGSRRLRLLALDVAIEVELHVLDSTPLACAREP